MQQRLPGASLPLSGGDPLFLRLYLRQSETEKAVVSANAERFGTLFKDIANWLDGAAELQALRARDVVQRAHTFFRTG